MRLVSRTIAVIAAFLALLAQPVLAQAAVSDSDPALVAEARLNSIRMRRIDADVQLVRALGGGYRPETDNKNSSLQPPSTGGVSAEKETT